MTQPETALAVREEPSLSAFQVIERVITSGDLGQMKPEERVAFYWRTCESLGLNPLTRPFEFITLNSKLTMYARKDATDQLRRLNGVSVTRIERAKDDDLGLITVTVTGVDRAGREDQATGVVSIAGLRGEALANAVMKAETKAKRRLTLSLVGLGFLDESEVEGASIDVDPMTGALLERPKPKSLMESVKAQQEAMSADTAPPAEEPVEAAFVMDDEPVEGVIDEAPEVKSLSPEAFRGLVKQAGIETKTVADTARHLFPGAAGMAALDDDERAVLWAELEKGAAA